MPSSLWLICSACVIRPKFSIQYFSHVLFPFEVKSAFHPSFVLCRYERWWEIYSTSSEGVIGVHFPSATQEHTLDSFRRLLGDLRRTLRLQRHQLQRGSAVGKTGSENLGFAEQVSMKNLEMN